MEHPESLQRDLSVSVILEWDNVRLSEMSRCRQMLECLASQIHELRNISAGPADDIHRIFLSRFRGPVTLTVLYDSGAMDGKVVEGVLRECIPSDNPDVEMALLPAPGMRYYQLKNFGAQHASGDFIVFIDSDVIPQHDWLLHLLSPFVDSTVKGVSGNAFIDYHNLYSKAFALCWFFPLRSEEKRVYREPHFFANNLAFRRETFQKYPFPTLAGATRRPCLLLAETLQKNNVVLVRSSMAQVGHPPPHGLRHFVIRALAQGRDHLLFLRQSRPQYATWYGTLSRFKQNIFKAVQRTLRDRARVQLTIAEVPVVFLIFGFYYTLYLFGEIMTRVNPNFMEKRIVI